MSSPNTPNVKRGGPRGGGGRGRGRGGGRRPGRGRSNKRSNDRNTNGNGAGSGNGTTNNNGATNGISSPGSSNMTADNALPTSLPGMRDEEVLIAFMPYLKGDNQEAMAIHEHYQSNNDQQAFLRAARDFLQRIKDGSTGHNVKSLSNSTHSAARTTPPAEAGLTPIKAQHSQSLTISGGQPTPLPTGNPGLGYPPNTKMPSNPFHHPAGAVSTPTPYTDRPLDAMDALERDMMGLIADDDPVVEMPGMSSSAAAIGGSTLGSSPASQSIRSTIFDSYPTHGHNPHQNNNNSSSIFFPTERQLDYNSQTFGQYPQPPPQRQPITPPRPGTINPINHGSASPFSTLFPNSTTNSNSGHHSPFLQNPIQRSSPQTPSGGAGSWPNNLMIRPTEVPNETKTPEPAMTPRSPLFSPSPSTPDVRPDSKPTETPLVSSDALKTPAKKEFQPKRLWTHLDEQPGKILANNVAPAVGTVLNLHPREELKAQWVLPLSYLRQHAASKGTNATSLRDLLEGLAVGLFRRGCTENGAQASIVSKEILAPADESRSDYPFQIMNDVVVGSVPFFSPRTPGHVVLRLYWQEEPLYTLATGPTLNVRVTEKDFESSIRFILSNFKAKKVNPTSLSSLNSLALVLEQFQLPPSMQQQRMAQQLEGAGRGVWGCICEARKVLDACASEYQKTVVKLQKLDDSVEELKATVADEAKKNGKSESQVSNGSDDEGIATDDDNDNGDEEEEDSENVLALREKQKALMSGRASCERKWRDSQLAFASILKAVVTNPSMSVILRRELISKLRLEYELWCPLSEEFAVPGEMESKMWYEPLNNLPHVINADHFRMCAEARSKMQQRSLGFDPNTSSLENVLYSNKGRNRPMNPAAVSVFNQLSAAMGQLYQDNYATADRILRQREMIRLQTEAFVRNCECFPPGTKVAIFGSSANGFGSPKSDLDMCLQIPPGQNITDSDDPTGAAKMAKLAKILEENGMEEVDTARLTARIPVIKFNCPRPMYDSAEGEEPFMECDLSMHNPLAVLNTALLRTYAEINPVPRVLAGVIKRWAKARDINNPARHTLSSYGYIIMLIHFLTYHQRAGNGLVITPTSRNDSTSSSTSSTTEQTSPLLPNLQWMDPSWPEMPPGTPYREQGELPKKPIQHPLEERAAVNAYFYRPNTAMLQNLQRLFPGQDLSLGILLASFFRYYAYEFDYKRYVVSLHSTLTHGLVEREVKAELDGWRNYSAALTIEDPFETFYDVAHVLRGGYYHRIRREFAMAYSKIADVASGKTSSTWNNKQVDLTKMVGMELIDWICEPVAVDRDDASSQR